MFSLSYAGVNASHTCPTHLRSARSTSSLVLLTFAATFTCYVDRVGFPIVYTALALTARVSRTIQGSVHSAFYSGYIVTQVPGGYLATRYGGEKVLQFAFTMWGAVSAVMPSDGTRTRVLWLCRFGVGCAMGTVFPALHSVMARAVPLETRNRAVSFMTSGMYFGSAFAMVFVPCVMGLGGAHLAFTAVGFMALMWSQLCARFTKHHEFTQAVTECTASSTSTDARRQSKTPWMELFSSPPVLVIMLNNFTFHYTFFILMSWMPTFYEQQLKTDVSSFTVLKTVPYFVMAVFSNVGGVIADMLMVSPYRSRTFVRKALNSSGFAIGAIALWFLPNCSHILSTALLSSLALGALASARAGFAVNHMDIAPRLAGVIMGISNTCGALAGMIGPWLTGCMLDAAAQPWEIALRTPACLCVLGAIMYVWFATAEQMFE